MCSSYGAMLVDQSAQLFAADINHGARVNFLSMIPVVLDVILEKATRPCKIVLNLYLPHLPLFYCTNPYDSLKQSLFF